jgi:hypothetical protein
MRIATVGLRKLEAMNARKSCCDWPAPRWPSAAGVLCALALAFCAPGRAACEEGGISPPAKRQIADFGGVRCSLGAPFWEPLAATAEELPWRSVWLGHFSGGRPYQDPYFGLTLIDWLDMKVCFPDRPACEAWVKGLRRAYHRPEGYWTCLLLR